MGNHKKIYNKNRGYAHGYYKTKMVPVSEMLHDCNNTQPSETFRRDAKKLY
jgi:hypothetical protein